LDSPQYARASTAALMGWAAFAVTGRGKTAAEIKQLRFTDNPDDSTAKSRGFGYVEVRALLSLFLLVIAISEVGE